MAKKVLSKRVKHTKRVYGVFQTMKEGYNQISWVVSAAAFSALLGQAIGVYGAIGFALTFTLFYGVGHFHNKVTEK